MDDDEVMVNCGIHTSIKHVLYVSVTVILTLILLLAITSLANTITWSKYNVTNHLYSVNVSRISMSSSLHTYLTQLTNLEILRTSIDSTLHKYMVLLANLETSRISVASSLHTYLISLVNRGLSIKASAMGTSFHSLMLTLVNLSTVGAIKYVRIIGPSSNTFYPGYNYSVVIGIMGDKSMLSLSKLVFTINGSTEVLTITTSPMNDSVSLNGVLARYVRNVDIVEGDVVINTTLTIPWNYSGVSTLSILTQNIFESAPKPVASLNIPIVNSVEVAGIKAPSKVAPNQEFNVYIDLIFENSTVSPPPGTVIYVNNTKYTVLSNGTLVVTLQAPRTPGNKSVTLSLLVDPTNQELSTTLNFTVESKTQTMTIAGGTTVPKRGGRYGGYIDYIINNIALILIIALIALMVIMAVRSR